MKMILMKKLKNIFRVLMIGFIKKPKKLIKKQIP
jgi:hypothetical protein